MRPGNVVSPGCGSLIFLILLKSFFMSTTEEGFPFGKDFLDLPLGRQEGKILAQIDLRIHLYRQPK
jgi:hypothetical protein